MNIQDWFPLGLTGLISMQSKGLSRVFSSTTIEKQPSFGTQPSLWSNSHIHTWLLEKTVVFDYTELCLQSISLLFNTLSSFLSFPFKGQVSFNFLAVVTICSDFRGQENKICHCFHFFPFYLPWSDGAGCHELKLYFFFLILSFKPAVSLSTFTNAHKLSLIINFLIISPVVLIQYVIWKCY